MNEQIPPSADLDRVLHEPGRKIIVALLAAIEECDFLYLLRETGLSEGELTSELTSLEQIGYVQIEKTNRGSVPQTLLRLTHPGREAFEEYRKKLNAAVAEQLKVASAPKEPSRSRSSSH